MRASHTYTIRPKWHLFFLKAANHIFRMQISQSPKTKAIFLDKDGTLIRDLPYNADPALVVFEAGVFEGLRTLQAQGYQLAIISNQPGLAMGKFTSPDLDKLIQFFNRTFQENELELAGFYYCPHAPAELGFSCACRKPEPGMLVRAAEELHIDLQQSWMIGDILNDVEAGNRAGCRTVLIGNGNETEWLTGPFRDPVFTASNFLEAATYISTQKETTDA
ncbi:Histidine biosynthesis bifunctional protein HisB [Dyadobacter sp. CECT 9623]|uniref:D,D-heptose 1,7-bisphosphate phosphatase n=2 Tax=Dyadobacter linearis TaxID=2823330 RepID=A0ABM8UJY7_9BACT|nr:Histidine biosynthesis bifunctional protein HisB [Dyadobacter sp. CECT 9623]